SCVRCAGYGLPSPGRASHAVQFDGRRASRRIVAVVLDVDVAKVMPALRRPHPPLPHYALHCRKRAEAVHATTTHPARRRRPR
ncbi:Carbamate kinase 2, partial [Frankliniella fusca]